MPLFVDQTIEINAPQFKVWEVLTKLEYTREWAPEFAGGAPLRIESDWRISAPVLWKDANDQIIVEGNVTRFEPDKVLRFTVVDVRTADNRPKMAEEDGITFELTQKGSHTMLHLRQGDFSSMSEAEKYHQLSAQVWERVLPKIKMLAERPSESA